MRTKTYVGLSLASLLLASVVVVACGGSKLAKCTPGELDVDIQLDDNAMLADHVLIYTNTPATMLSVPHTPGSFDDLNVKLTWPTGYPANTLVNVHFEAYVGTSLLGVDVQSIHLGASCTSAFTEIGGDLLPPDLLNADGISVDGGN